MQGNFELNVQIPLMARNLLQSIELLAAACRLLRRVVRRRDRGQPGAVRALRRGVAGPWPRRSNPYIGYDAATAIVKDAAASGRSLREVAREHGVEDDVLDKALDLRGDGARKPVGSPMTSSCSSTSPASRPASSRTCCATPAPRSTASSWTRASRCPPWRDFDADRRDGRPDERERRGRAPVAGRREAADRGGRRRRARRSGARAWASSCWPRASVRASTPAPSRRSACCR